MLWSATLLAMLLLQKPDAQADGLKALEGQRYEEAVQLFTKAAAADPKDYGAHFNLALAYSLLKRDAEAILEYQKVLELKPELYEAELNLGILLVRDKEPGKAVAHLESAMKTKPNQFRPTYYSAEAYLGAGQLEKAEAAYKEALQLDGKAAAAELGLGRTLAREQRLPEAAAHFEKAAELDPAFRDALLELASLYEANKQNDEAVALYRKFPDNAAAKERAGELLLESGKASDAIPELEEAVRKSPTVANRYALATAYVANKEIPKALPLLAAALKDEPANLELRLKYGRALRDEKKYQEAAQQFYQVTQAKPDSVEAWSELAGMLMLLQNDPQALAALDKVRTLGGEKPGHYYLRAIILDRNKQLQGALENYQKFLSMSDGKAPNEEFKARQRARILQKEISKK